MSRPGNARPHVFNAKDHGHLTPWLAGLHAQCITSDKLISAFMPPLSQEKLLSWWKDRIAETIAGTRVIIMLLLDTHPGTKVPGDALVGVAMLSLPHLETGPFRANIESILVSTKYRRRRGATVLLEAVEQDATIKGKTLLVSCISFCCGNLRNRILIPYSLQMAEMESGTPAEIIFKQFHYQVAGKVPKYSLKPGGEMKDVVFLYKNLAH